MNALTRPSRPEPRAETPPKAVLFCPSCDRRAPVSDWVATATATADGVDTDGTDGDAEGEALTCPACGETLTVRRRDRT